MKKSRKSNLDPVNCIADKHTCETHPNRRVHQLVVRWEYFGEYFGIDTKKDTMMVAKLDMEKDTMRVTKLVLNKESFSQTSSDWDTIKALQKIKQYAEAIEVVQHSKKTHNPLQEDFKKLFLNPRQTDSTVEVKGGRNNDVKTFKTYKFILVARCPVFGGQYYSEPTNNHYVIELKDSVLPSELWSTSDFEEVLYFLYTHQMRSTVSSSEEYMGILIIAHYLQLDALVTICEIKLVTLLSLDSLHHSFVLSQNMLDLKLLRQKCDEFIVNLPQEVKDNTLKKFLLDPYLCNSSSKEFK